MATLEQGRIVWAELPSSDGTSKKRRPSVILTETDEIAPGKAFFVVTATTKFTEPLSLDQVHLPWHREGRVRTRLSRPTVAVCSWVAKILESDILQYGGVVPPKEMLQIIEKMKRALG